LNLRNSAPLNVSTSPTLPNATQDLENDWTRKTAVINPIKKQLSAHLSTLDNLENIDRNYLAEISSYSAQLERIKSCNNSLITAYPQLQSNQQIVSALDFYNSKKSVTDSLRNEITQELGLIATLRTLIATTLSGIEASNSTEEILAKFNFYQDQVDSQGLPTITASAAREGEYQMYKFNIQQDLTSGGTVPTLISQCEELAAQMNIQTRTINNNNNGD
jgi:hypothetical protein